MAGQIILIVRRNDDTESKTPLVQQQLPIEFVDYFLELVKISDTLTKRLSFSHYGGKASAYEDLSKSLSQEAGEAFVRKDEKLARTFRDFADKTANMAKDIRSTQKQYE